MGTDESKELVLKDFPWMSGSREDRKAKLLAYFRGMGDNRMAPAHAQYRADDVLSNLCGDARPILERLEQGMSVRKIADEFGYRDESVVYAWLMQNAPAEWAKFSSGRALARMYEAEDKMEAATDNVGVSKYSNIIRSSQWQLERTASRMYGQQKEAGMTINVVLDPSCGGTVQVDGSTLTIGGSNGGSSGYTGGGSGSTRDDSVITQDFEG